MLGVLIFSAQSRILQGFVWFCDREALKNSCTKKSKERRPRSYVGGDPPRAFGEPAPPPTDGRRAPPGVLRQGRPQLLQHEPLALVEGELRARLLALVPALALRAALDLVELHDVLEVELVLIDGPPFSSPSKGK